MTKYFLIVIIFCFQFLILVEDSEASSLSRQLSGRIIINVESKGEAWYVYPVDYKRYYLGRPQDAFRVMRELGLGINEIDFQKIAQAGMPVNGDLNLARRLSGRIILQTERNGEAWYINPLDLKKYYLGRPHDAFNLMRQLGLGISRINLAGIHKAGTEESIDSFSQYFHKTVRAKNKDYAVDYVVVDLSNPKLKIITDTADTSDCESNCRARNLASYIFANNGFAAINGTYFDTSSSKKNYYFFPVYNSANNVLINEDQLKYWTTGPIMAFDTNNKFYYFKDSREFKSVEYFEKTYNAKLGAAIGNKPRLIENKMNLLIEWDIDPKQRNGQYARNAIGYKDNKIYLVVAAKATIPELADIMQAMEMDYALNLDGGYSSALWYNDEYMVGPGRDIPNAIIFSAITQ